MGGLPKVCVLGGGNGAFATASDLAMKGCEVSLCEVPEMEQNVLPVKECGGIDLSVVIDIPGMQSGFVPLENVGVDPEPALKDAELVLVVVPAFAHRRFAEFAGPYLRPDQIVVLTPGNFGGSLEFVSVLKENGIAERPTVVDVECMLYSGFKHGPAAVEVSGFKRKIVCAALPATETARALEMIHKVYPGVGAAEHVLEIGLRNGNFVIHPPITILNAGWAESPLKFRFYWDGLTPGVSAAVEALEAERMAVGEALDLKLKPNRDVIIGYYEDQGAKGETFTDVLRTNPVYGIDWAPQNLQHRFIMEDVPYGMVPMESLARMVDVPTPVCTGLIELASAMVEKDLREDARDLRRLGLEGMTLDSIKDMVNVTGG